MRSNEKVKMDLSKIFLEDACPTKMGGQAVMEGIMMKGEDKTALAVRMSDGSVKVETEMTKKPRKMDEDTHHKRRIRLCRFAGQPVQGY